MADNINSFVATLDELLRFLDSYQEDLFYVDINASPPPQGARHFEITTFPSAVAENALDELHPGPNAPRATPLAREKMGKLTGKVECGVNIHPKHGQGWTNIPQELAKSKWVRFPFMSSPAQFPSLEAAFQFFDPVIDAYNKLGTKVMLILTHQTYGEGAGYNWDQMDSVKWQSFTPQFVAVVEKIAQRYGNRVAAYEVWNEGDVDLGNPAAVAFAPTDFAPLLQRSAQVIRANAPNSKIVLGGLVTAADKGASYVQQVMAKLGGKLPVDAIGVHPYGLGAPDDQTIFARFGSIQNSINEYQKVAPNVPLWFTEVGAMGANDPSYWDDAASYMRKLFAYLSTQADKVPVVIWYAWSDAMHADMKTNGLVTVDGQPKDFIYDTFFNEACK